MCQNLDFELDEMLGRGSWNDLLVKMVPLVVPSARH
jgi:hypothetical protein